MIYLSQDKTTMLLMEENANNSKILPESLRTVKVTMP